MEKNAPLMLVVEDDNGLRDDLILALEFEGFRAVGAGNAESALRLAREMTPDLVLLDLTLPDRDGLDVARELKHGRSTRDIPIIVLSGRGSQADIIAALDYAEDFVRKPFQVAEVKARLRTMLRLSQAQTHLRQLNAQLEERVIERTSAILRTARQLEEELSLRRESEERIFELNRQLLEVREDERSRLAREIHDNLGQQLVALKWRVQALQQELPDARPIAAILEGFDQLAASARSIAHDLNPDPLHPQGLSAAIEQLACRFAPRLSVSVDLDALHGALDAAQQTHLYRIVQEALTNAVRHSDAERVRIAARAEGEHTQLIIADDGGGIAASERDAEREGLGLRIMRQRAAAVGGEIEVRNHEKGLRITLTIPADRQRYPDHIGGRS